MNEINELLELNVMISKNEMNDVITLIEFYIYQKNYGLVQKT